MAYLHLNQEPLNLRTAVKMQTCIGAYARRAAYRPLMDMGMLAKC
jgi:hypothetical protein